MTDREAYVALNMMEGIGPVTVASLMSTLGSIQAVFQAGRSDLLAARGVGPGMADLIIEKRGALDPAREIERASELGLRVITRAEEDYPKRLREIHDPPLALYVSGTLETGDRQAIAVVGTRHATHYGRDCAERLSYQLAQVGFCVVSGLALGIDTVAHRGALKAGGRTLAVIGSGPDAIYPAENRGLAREISERGAVLSEFPLGRQPDKTTFPIRNRIVSGLSMGVLVIEAGTTSGALITARQAAEQGRTVYAVPGRIDSPASRGTHGLLKTGARLVEDVQDILDELEFLIPARVSDPALRDGPRPRLTPEETKIVEALKDGGLDVDSLIRASALDASRVSSLLIGLEMKKVVRMLPGRMVELSRRSSES